MMRALLLLLPALYAGRAVASSLVRRQTSPTYTNPDNTIGALSDTTLDLVKARCMESSTGSWENGTLAQALLEHQYPMLSVFYNPTIPISPLAGIPSEVNDIAHLTIATKPNNTLMFTADTSAGDPASLGISVLVANVTSDADYMNAVNQENDFLLRRALRTSDGAVSHRVAEVQLWSDFIAMVPPYLAYYGALLGNSSMIQAAYDQCRLYRNYLTDGKGGLWRHIMLGSTGSQDPGYWSTGNAWAANGMLRVLVTMMHTTNYSATDIMSTQKEDLKNWIVEILTESWSHLDATTGLLPNYLAETTFSDAAATALLSAVTYRMAQLGLDNSTLTIANTARQAVYSGVDVNTGWLAPVVNPRNWSAIGENSPEAQAFVLMLSAAQKDYVNVTGDTTSGGGTTTEPGQTTSTTASPTSQPSSEPSGGATGRESALGSATSLAILAILLSSAVISC